MKKSFLIAAAAALVAVAGSAAAQVAALGSTARGGTSQVGRTLAAAVSDRSTISSIAINAVWLSARVGTRPRLRA